MADRSGVRIAGALAAHRQGLWSALLARGYSPLSARNLLRLAAHLSRWLDEQGIALEELTHERVAAFFEARRCAGYTGFRTPRSLAPVLRHLEQAGAVTLPAPVRPEPSALDRLIDGYTEYLLRERGITESSARAYGDIARRFLAERLGADVDAVARLEANDVISFVLETASRYSIGATKYVVTVLRSLLRYLYLENELDVDLAKAVPAVAGWRLRGLPKALDAGQVRRVLHGCDRRRHVGRRDHAILLLMVRLGLRCAEAGALTLEDIDWNAGELRVCGKGRHEERLPVPADVGEALARYLRTSRPRSDARELFLSVRAPHGPLGSSAVNAVVRQAFARAGLPARNAHRLRHTAATQMLRAGASLDEIAQVLRHRSHDTTAIYAKVDRAALQLVTRPWPGALS